MSKKTFGAVAERLASNGYEPVPIIRGEKRPASDRWQDGGFERQTSQYEKNFTGLLTRFTPGVDIDVSDPELVEAVRSIVFDVTGCYEVPPPRRIGNAPRELLLFRTEEEFGKVSTASYALSTDKAGPDGKIKGSKVEILASGQQFVAYAIHPDTKKPYEWNGGGEPLNLPRNQLITLDESQAQEIIARCEVLLSMHGTPVERKAMTSGSLADRVPGEKLEAEDPILAMAALGAMPNPDLAFDDWLRVLYATKSALGEEGKDTFMSWSSKSIKHDQTFADKEWFKAKPTRIGAGTLIWVAKRLGWAPHAVRLASSTAIDDDGVIHDHDGVMAWPDPPRGKSTKPPATLENFAYLSQVLGIKYSMDVMRGQEVVSVPGMSVAEGTEANSAVTYMLSAAVRAELPHALVPDFMSMLCAQNPYHPVHHWIESKPWDGVSRVQAWMDTITAKDTKLKESMMRKWAISAIAGLYKPGGVSAHGVLTFLGPQGLGKTSWFLSLSPKELGFSKDGMILRPDLPDSVRQVTGYWLVELGELDATFRKSDIAALKAFITQSSDTYRLPYARKNTVNPRRTVFFASVNDDKFLSDNTGNRRYWTIECEAINYEHNIDMQQFWAEIKNLFEAGETWFLDANEASDLNVSNEQYLAIDPIIERVDAAFNWSADPSTWGWMTATQVCLAAGVGNPSRGDATRIAGYLKNTRDALRRKTDGSIKFRVPPTFEPKWA
jgi:hypothetical protein